MEKNQLNRHDLPITILLILFDFMEASKGIEPLYKDLQSSA